jgi:hypothetical protein
VFLDRRPVVAGLFLALLTFKPQFGPLFPLALIAGRHWRAMASAVVGSVVLAAASAAAFGIDTWRAFLASTDATVTTMLGEGKVGWAKMQSAYGLVQLYGGGEILAWAAQGVLMLVSVVVVVVAFRRRASLGVRGAILAAASVLASPYAFVCDQTINTVAAAFLAGEGLRRGFLPGERAGIAAALLLPGLTPHLIAGGGPMAGLLILGLAIRAARVTPPLPPCAPP